MSSNLTSNNVYFKIAISTNILNIMYNNITHDINNIIYDVDEYMKTYDVDEYMKTYDVDEYMKTYNEHDYIFSRNSSKLNHNYNLLVVSQLKKLITLLEIQ